MSQFTFQFALVCALASVALSQICAPGQTPYLDTTTNPPSFRQCTPGGANTCPALTFCQNVATNAAPFQNLCCQNLPASCPNGLIPYTLPITSSPVPCTLGAVNACPTGSSCQSMATNPAGIQTLCCRDSTVVVTPTPPVNGGTPLQLARCSNFNERPLKVTGSTFFVNCAGNTAVCPTNYHCEFDFINNVYPCCGTPVTTGTGNPALDCPKTSVWMYPQSGTPYRCPTAGTVNYPCSGTYPYCVYSPSYEYNVCCTTSIGGTAANPTNDCSDANVLKGSWVGNAVAYCPSIGFNTGCPTTNPYCNFSPSRNQNVCCSINF